jgi:hypothetical protein
MAQASRVYAKSVEAGSTCADGLEEEGHTLL